MNILITGGTGLIGTALRESLQEKGHQITIVSRNPQQIVPGVRLISWDLDPLITELEGTDAVVNLAGASLAGNNPLAMRWTKTRRREIINSRIKAGETLCVALEKAQQKLDAFKAEAKVVIDDKFFGAPTPKQFKNPTVTGNYQAKINLPKPAHDFLPPEPPSFGDVNAKIVLNSDFENDPASNKDQSENQPQRTKAMKASSAKVISENDSNDPIARGLELASEQTTSPQYALHGKCPITLLQDSKWVDGDPKIGCVHRNRIYIFTNEANLKAFQSDPDANSPILAGYDPVVFQETGRLVDGLEKHGVFMGKPPQQRIVLFATAETRARFQSQPKKYLEAVRQAMKSTGASSKLLR